MKSDTEELQVTSIPAQRMERLAWALIWSAFLLFCLLFLASFLGARWLYSNTMATQEARLASITGTLLVQSSPQALWTRAALDDSLKEGSRLRAEGDSQALLRLFEDSTILLLPDSQVTLVHLQRTRFNDRSQAIEVLLEFGSIQVGVSLPRAERKDFLVSAPSGSASLGEGSYTFHRGEEDFRIRAGDRGKAIFFNNNDTITVEAGGWGHISKEGKLRGPFVTPVELLFNGDFSQGLAGWRRGDVLGFLEGKDLVGDVSLLLEENAMVSFRRRGSSRTYAESYLFQELGRDVTDLSELYLSLRFRLLYQDLSGGGYLGTEYPLMVKIDYDSSQGPQHLLFGFYSQNNSNNRTDYGVAVPQGQWMEHTVPQNLMALSPKPRKLISIQVSAGGWDYETLLDRVGLAGK